MEIFVRGYQDSNGDGIGDLKGLTQRLDYLRDLGIKGIWLMPVNASEDHDHGYSVMDYRNIEADYGTLADFDAFIREAHARGIGVIVDYVLNHGASLHPLFVNARASRDNPYRHWFIWVDKAPKGWKIMDHDPWRTTPEGVYFTQFSNTMPDFNFRNPRTLEFHMDSLRFWLNRGVDGFRFDAVPHLIETGPKQWYGLPESHALMNDVRRMVTSYERRYIVCEATGDMLRWAQPDSCGSAFAFGHQYKIVKAAQGHRKAVRAVAEYFRKAPLSMATMVSNHDLFAGKRLWDQVHGDRAQYQLAAATYLLQPGTPFIYYGEEIGMSGVPGLAGDKTLRTPMSWTGNQEPAPGGFTTGTPFRPLSPNVRQQNAATQLADPHSLLAFYKTMIGLRNTRASLARGSYEGVVVTGNAMAFQRKLGDETTLVLINYGKAAALVPVTGLPSRAALSPAYPERAEPLQAGANGKLAIRMPPQSVAVYAVTP
jgi:glycosidase